MEELNRRGWALQAELAELGGQLRALASEQILDLQREMERVRQFYLWAFSIGLVLSSTIASILMQHSVIEPLYKAQSDLAHERGLLRILFDNIPDCIYFKTASSQFIRINKAECELLGVEKDADAVGHTDFDYFAPAVAQKCFDEEQEMLRSGDPVISRIEQLDGPGGETLDDDDQGARRRER